MASEKLDDLTSEDTTSETSEAENSAEAEETQATEEEKPELSLEVSIDTPSACVRHVTVTISRDDIDRYYENAFSEMMPTATVPGFRVGRAPRKLVEHRYRKEVGDKIKGSLLVDSLEQISEKHELTAISEPEIDLEAIEVPDEGPMTYEFDIEVRPEFELPEWRGLKIVQPVCDFSDEDIDYQLEQILERHGQLVPFDGEAALGDYVSVNITCIHGTRHVNESEEEIIRIRPTLSFRDAMLDKFDELMAGAKAGDRRIAEVTLTQDAQNEELRGEKIRIQFDILELKKLRLPDLTDDFLEEMGDFESVEELREAIRKDLDRQLQYEQQQKIRQQISARLTESANWELPPEMLKRQSVRELERAVMELRRSGFSEAEIRARENELRQNSAAATAAALKEHFILERIAEEEEIDATDSDYETEISLIAMQSNETVRRVRAQLEKRDLMDVLRNQIVERKVLNLVESEAQFINTPYSLPRRMVEAIDLAAGGGGVATEIQENAEEKGKEEE
ncbi:MAG: trigger factor [Pirellulales bacterium]|nr:trigger factor [Pirellulales bacterium]